MPKRKNKKTIKLKLPTGAVVRVRRLSATEVRYQLLRLMIEEVVEPGAYKLDVDGKIEPLSLKVVDANYIEEWARNATLKAFDERNL